MKRVVKAELTLGGEAAYFLEMVKSETGMEYNEIFSKMIDLYKQIYLSEQELAWIEGDIIKKKLSSEALRRSTI